MKPVKIELDKERNLLLDLNAMAGFGEETGKNLFQIGENFSASDLRALLWACLIHEEPSLDPKDVGAMIHPGNMEYVQNKIEEVYSKQMPADEGKEKNKSRATGQSKN